MMANALQNLGFSIWMDKENIKPGGNFLREISNAFLHCGAFILILSKEAMESPWVEIEIATAVSQKLPLIPFKIDKEPLSTEFSVALKCSQYIDASDGFQKGMKYLIETLQSIDMRDADNNFDIRLELQQLPEQIVLNPTQTIIKRIENKYNTVRFKTQERLRLQGEMFSQYNKPIYDELFESLEDAIVLDIGCNNGNNIYRDIGNRENCRKIIGIDCSKEVYEQAVDNYQDTKLTPLLVDCENENFEQNIFKIMKDNSIEGFDLVIISMVLLHLKAPLKVLKSARKFLKKGGRIFIRDIDDGLIVTYPDPQDLLKKAKDIDYKLLHTGVRHCGREIFSLLKASGFHNIKSCGESIDTINKDYDERYTMFFANFSYITENIEDMIKMFPNSEEFRKYLEWAKDNIDEIEIMFQSDSFFFKMGTVVFVAEK